MCSVRSTGCLLYRIPDRRLTRDVPNTGDPRPRGRPGQPAGEPIMGARAMVDDGHIEKATPIRHVSDPAAAGTGSTPPSARSQNRSHMRRSHEGLVLRDVLAVVVVRMVRLDELPHM